MSPQVRDVLPTPADLARVLRAGLRNADSLKVTGPIREAVDDRLRRLSGGTVGNVRSAPQPTGGSRVQFLDRVDLGTRGVYPVMRFNSSVVWWGAFAWGKRQDTEEIFNLVGQLDLDRDVWLLEHESGCPEIPSDVSLNGWFFRAFKRLTEAQIEQLETLEGLVVEIATDLWWWHQRLNEANLLR